MRKSVNSRKSVKMDFTLTQKLVSVLLSLNAKSNAQTTKVYILKKTASVLIKILLMSFINLAMECKPIVCLDIILI